ncbi:MAG: serine hydrolase [Kiloniellales bacterium]
MFSSGAAFARYASIVIDADTGRVLHAENADTRNYPASLTKLMTLYLAFEALDDGRLALGQRLQVSRRAAGQAPSKLGLKPGETITVRDAILALITKSANDAATVIAEALSGSERRFARTMTDKARALGMTRTSFRNASGLPNRRQLSTARDMASLTLALQRDFPHHYGYFATGSFHFRGNTYRNHNDLLARYPGTDGLKTGYIRASGYNVAASVERHGRRLIGVVLGGKSPRWRNRHMMRLFEKSFRRLDREWRPGKRSTAASSAAPPSKERPVPQAAGADPGKGWGIQVGAFQDQAPARWAVGRARRGAPALLQATRTVIEAVEIRGRRLFRARLSGLDRQEARRACRVLRTRKLDCHVVPPPGSVKLAKAY